jgi:2-polyprenyl-3-methyl-5-hydroxy-6-metoxy-1,4-benzoquinol methylase
MTSLLEHENSCRVCGHSDLTVVKKSNIKLPLESSSFSITDDNYGITAELHKCNNCGFIQDSGLKDVLAFYEGLQDAEYVRSGLQRLKQARHILRITKRYHHKGRLLDVGSGMGTLVKEAMEIGYEAEGIEPSRSFQKEAAENGLSVYPGTLPHSKIKGPYQIITLVDVLEHVSNPLNLLLEIRKIISDDGIVGIAVPDSQSLMARILGFRWWHFRLAHIGYYNKNNLKAICEKAGLKLLRIYRPLWYFRLDYLAKRINFYLPETIKVPAYSFLKNITVPLNLRDSIFAVFSVNKNEKKS